VPFRSRVFLVLAVVGFVPLLVLGWLSFSVNRTELETTVGRAHEATAVAAARAGSTRFRFAATGPWK